jgi:hypothetical protein
LAQQLPGIIASGHIIFSGKSNSIPKKSNFRRERRHLHGLIKEKVPKVPVAPRIFCSSAE